LVFQMANADSGSEWLRSFKCSTDTSLGVSMGGQFVPAAEYHREWGIAYWGVTGPAELIPIVQNVEPAQTAEKGEYDPEFVARILNAAAQPPEARFNNVVDMLAWLNRD
jgi:hypothetical protein